MWGQLAQDILNVAAGAVTVDRAYVASGPEFRRDCRQVVVHLATPGQPPGPVGEIQFARCATLPQVTYQVTFTADCVPAPSDDGSPPPGDTVTGHATAFLDDCEAIHHALARACTSLARQCSTVSLGTGVPSGPSGLHASMAWPLTLVLT